MSELTPKNNEDLFSLPQKPIEMSPENSIKMLASLTERLKKTDPQKDKEAYERLQKAIGDLNRQGYELPLGERIP